MEYETTPENYKKLHDVFQWQTHDKRFVEDLQHDFYLYVLEGNKPQWIWQFLNRHERKYYDSANTHYRKTKDDPTLKYTEIEENTVEEDLDLADLVSKVSDITSRISLKNADKMMLLYLEGYTYSEIGTELGYTKQGVGKVIKKVLDLCRKVLDREYKL